MQLVPKSHELAQNGNNLAIIALQHYWFQIVYAYINAKAIITDINCNNRAS